MERRIIWRGLLAGAIGGLLAFLFARAFPGPQTQQAIDYEDGRDHAQEALNSAAGIVPHEHGETFSRAVQGNVGIGVGMLLFGVAMGALFAVAYAICLGRTGRVRPRSLALLVAGGGFLGAYLVPFLKYPANPPAIGHAETISVRGTLYLVMVAASIVLLIGAVAVGRWLRGRLSAWNAVLAGGAFFVVTIGLVMALLPSLGELSANVAQYGHHATETPLPLTDASGTIVFPGFPADVLAGFRLYSVLAQALLWAAIGLVFAPLADRLLTTSGSERASATAA